MKPNIISSPIALTIIIVLSVLVGASVFYISKHEFLSEKPEILEKTSQDISEEQAINLVKELPKVKEWLALFSEPGNVSPTTGGTPVIIMYLKEKGVYNIQAFEQLPDRRVNFNYYEVDAKTGEVTPLF